MLGRSLKADIELSSQVSLSSGGEGTFPDFHLSVPEDLPAICHSLQHAWDGKLKEKQGFFSPLPCVSSIFSVNPQIFILLFP